MDEPIVWLDTFPRFVQLWSRRETLEPDAVRELWLEYMGPYPKLLQKQIDSYSGDGLDWQSIAMERVYPLYLPNIDRMRVAHESVGRVYGALEALPGQFSISPQPMLVTYVGIGCGAGWATTYGDRPAILVGLEKVAECGWQDPPLVASLIAHEYGHLYCFSLRSSASCKPASSQAMALFDEGFAQWFDHMVCGAESWSLCSRLNDSTWPEWCRDNLGALAREYLQLIQSGGASNAFFGDWLEVRGRKQVGYYLGYEFIKSLLLRMSIQQVAKLEDVNDEVAQFLMKYAAGEA